MKTLRQEMESILQKEQVGVRELSQELHISEKEVYGHLEHLARSLQTKGKKLQVDPAACLDCGFVFRDRKKLTPPGHCPKCKSSHLRRPLFHIV